MLIDLYVSTVKTFFELINLQKVTHFYIWIGSDICIFVFIYINPPATSKETRGILELPDGKPKFSSLKNSFLP